MAGKKRAVDCNLDRLRANQMYRNNQHLIFRVQHTIDHRFKL